MKTIEELLKLLPETLRISGHHYLQFIYKDSFGYKDDEINDDWIEELRYFTSLAYIAITTDSARYKIKDIDGYWMDLIVFYGNPTEAINNLYDWYLHKYLQLTDEDLNK